MIPYSVLFIIFIYIVNFISDVYDSSKGGKTTTHSSIFYALDSILSFIIVFWLVYDFFIR